MLLEGAKPRLVVSMTVNLVQILREDGSIPGHLKAPLADEDLVRIYRTMLLVRTADTKAVSLQRQGRIGSYVPCAGEEACQVGSAYALGPDDWVFPQYRSQGVALTRGLSLERFFAQLFGTSMDLSKGHQQPMSLGDKGINYVAVSSPVGTHCPLAVGAGLAARYLGRSVATIVYFGDGTTSSNDFHTGMNFAGVFKAPTIFFCMNNQYAISLHVSKQTASESLAIKAVAYGFEGVRVDGNDALAVYSVTKKALQKARAGDGPTLIEAVTYRFGAHSTSDDASLYRHKAEEEAWREKDPLKRSKAYLIDKGIWSEELEQEARQQIETEINRAVRAAESAPLPAPETLFEDVYSEMPWHLSEQRNGLLKGTSG